MPQSPRYVRIATPHSHRNPFWCNIRRQVSSKWCELPIIAILAAILFPVFAKAREKARQSTCQSNLKQIGVGIMQYAQDYDEMLPANYIYESPGANLMWWDDLIQPYTKNYQVLLCPSNTPGNQYTYARPAWTGVPNPLLYSYSANSNGAGSGAVPIGGGGVSLPLARLVSVANLILIAESNDIELNTYATEVDAWAANGIGNIRKLHNDGSNWLFADSHVKFLKKSEQSMWNPLL